MKARSVAPRCGAACPFDYSAVFGQVSGRMRARLSGVYTRIFHGGQRAGLVTHQQHQGCDTFHAICYANCNGFFVVVADST